MRLIRLALIVGLLFGSACFGGELSFADSLKSKMLERAVAVYFGIKGYGSVKKIELNSIDKTIAINLLPEGEKEELSILVGNYAIIAKEQKVYLQLNKITTNRIWLTRIFADHMPQGISVPLDEYAGGIGRAVF